MPPEFNKYEIIRKIGEGAQGEVYLARDKRLGRKVAIKSLHVDLITNTILKERFIGEAKLLGQLSHPSIVTLFDYIVDTSGYHLIMEYLKGNQLNDYIKEVSGPINEIRAIKIFLQILDGIHHIHKLNIVHRDIKPSNIIIDENDRIKLLDFGIAKDYSNDPNLTVVGQSVGGTPMYMSPEHISNAKITIQSDIYSLGVTFWHMLTGRAPYEGMSLAKIYSNIENEALPPIEKIYPFASKKLNDIVKKATAKDPKKRYDSCLSFMRAIEDLEELLIQQTNSEIPEIVSNEKNIDIRVKNVEDASFVINQIGHVGKEITFTGNPGTKLKIQIHKEYFRSIRKEMIINEDELIEIEMKRRLPALLSLLFLAFYFFVQSFFKVTLFLKHKKLLKLNEIKTNIIYENITKNNIILLHNINSVKAGILELISFFVITLFIILFLFFSIDNSKVIDDNLDIEAHKTTVVINEVLEEETRVANETQIKADEIEPIKKGAKSETNYPAKGIIKSKGGGGCDSKGNRIDIVHDGSGGTYRKKVYDTKYCPLPKTNAKKSTNNSSSSTTNIPNSQPVISDYQQRLESGVHDYYTPISFNGYKLIIDITGVDIEIRAYKNDKFYNKYNIKGELGDLRYNAKDNTLNTNYSKGFGPRKWLINLNDNSLKVSREANPYWKNSDIKISLTSN